MSSESFNSGLMQPHKVQNDSKSEESRESVPVYSADNVKFSNVIVNTQPYQGSQLQQKRRQKPSLDDEVRVHESIAAKAVTPAAEPESNFFFENSGQPSFQQDLLQTQHLVSEGAEKVEMTFKPSKKLSSQGSSMKIQ